MAALGMMRQHLPGWALLRGEVAPLKMTPETGVLAATMERSPWRSKLALLVSPTLPRSAQFSATHP